MAFAAGLAPYLAAAGTVATVANKYQTDKFNAQVTQNQQTVSVNQANAQEGMVRRNSREAFARQTAAFGASGAGYGGSSEGALDQSAINQEMDALNTRYKGAFTGYGYSVQSQQDRAAAGTDAVNGGLLAGSALLKGIGANYSFAPKSSSSTGSGTTTSTSYGTRNQNA